MHHRAERLKYQKSTNLSLTVHPTPLYLKYCTRGLSVGIAIEYYGIYKILMPGNDNMEIIVYDSNVQII